MDRRVLQPGFRDGPVTEVRYGLGRKGLSPVKRGRIDSFFKRTSQQPTFEMQKR